MTNFFFFLCKIVSGALWMPVIGRENFFRKCIKMYIFADNSAMMSRSRYLIVVAAGRGRRMGGDVPKQFMTLNGRTVLRRAIEAFTRAVPSVRVVTVLAEDWMEYWKELCLKQHFYSPQTLVAGGLTRFHSIRNALAVIPDDALVAVHDGARPLVSRELIIRLFDAAEKHSGVIPCCRRSPFPGAVSNCGGRMKRPSCLPEMACLPCRPRRFSMPAC